MLNSAQTATIPHYKRNAREVLISDASSGVGRYPQAEKLLTIQPLLQDCIKASQSLFESNFNQEHKTKIESINWLELHGMVLNLEKNLQLTLIDIEVALSVIALDLDTTKLLDIFSNWSTSSKRIDLLQLLNNYKINSELLAIIDDAFLEAPNSMQEIATVDFQEDLLNMLRDQIKDLSILSHDMQLATDAVAQEKVLRKILGDPRQSDELDFDVFVVGLSRLQDFELSFAIIALYMVLK